MASFVGELRRRNVFKVAVAYAIVGWLLIEVASTVLPTFEAPPWVLQTITFVIILGFPLALVFSWAFELTPAGLERTKTVPVSQSITHATGQKLNYIVTGLLVLAFGFFLVDQYLLEGSARRADLREAATPIVPDATEGAPALVRDALPNSVAVLPFENLSPDPDNAYFAAGIHEAILNELAKIRAMNVIARTSMLAYADRTTPIPEIARELNVETVMEGSVQYAGDRVRITAQLIDPATNAHLWSEDYDRDLVDVFSIQSDIAMNIANALEAEFSLAEQASIEHVPTESPAAYAYYLRALSAPTPASAQALLEQATSIDPEFALAYALTAYEYTFELVGLGGSSPGEAAELERLVRVNAERALALDPNLGTAQAALAVPHYVNWRGDEAEEAFRQAVALSPNDVNVLVMYGRFKRYRGEYEEATRLLRRAIELDPNNVGSLNQLAINYRQATNWAAAAAIYPEVLRGIPVAGIYNGFAYVQAARGNVPEAVRLLRVAESLEGANSFRLAQMAEIYSWIGREDEAMRVFAKLEEAERQNPVGDAVWAQVYMAIGDYDGALQHLQAAVNDRVPTDFAVLARFAANPYGDPVLERPEFRQLLDQLWDDQ
jgi:TolB-like protein/Flp pilus assembly protein TadD